MKSSSTPAPSNQLKDRSDRAKRTIDKGGGNNLRGIGKIVSQRRQSGTYQMCTEATDARRHVSEKAEEMST